MPITAPTLAITDNADETADAVITGGDAGATNTLSRITWTGAQGAGTWTASGSNVGPGTIAAVASGKGYFWWKVESVDGAESITSNLVYQKVTDGADAVHQQVHEAVVAGIQGLALDEIGSNVLEQFAPDYSNVQFPLILTTIEGEIETVVNILNNKDDIGYPVRVFFCDRLARQEEPAQKAKYLLWRQTVSRFFRHQRLSGVTQVNTCIINPTATLDPESPLYQYVVGSLSLVFVSHEPRGV